MQTDSGRLQVAQWILERNLGWIGAAEVKTGVIVAIDTAMLGALATGFGATSAAERTAWVYLLTIAATLVLGIALYSAGRVVLPALGGPPSSLIFFGRIAEFDSPQRYAEAFRKCNVSELTDDFLAQIHRNAEIARDKFRWVRASMAWSFVAILPWLAALSVLV